MADRYFGSHEFGGREHVARVSSERSFGLVFAGVFAVVGLFNLYAGGWSYWFTAAALFALLALAAPRTLAPLNKLWAKFGLLLHRIISPLILAILFYGCVTPIGFLMRLTGQGPDCGEASSLRRQSYWIVREPPGPDDLASLKNQF